MKKFLSLLFVILMIVAIGCDESEIFPRVEGKTYVGKPVNVNSDDFNGNEGAGERGSVKFYSHNNIDEAQIIWPGSDMVEVGSYVQTDSKIEIIFNSGKSYHFTLSEDGIEIEDDKYGIIFRDKNYPW